MVFLDHVQNLHIHAEKTHKYFGAHCMKYVNFVHDPQKQYKSLSVAHRPGGLLAYVLLDGGLSQFSDMLQFLSHQKIFYKTCMRAVKVVLNFRVILRMWPGPCTNVSDRPSSGNPRGLAVHVCRILCGACAHPQAPPRMHGSAVL